MQLLNGFVILDANEVQALDDLGGGRFPYSSVKPEKFREDLEKWKGEALHGDPGNDPLRMFAKEMIVLYSTKLLNRLEMLATEF